MPRCCGHVYAMVGQLGTYKLPKAPFDDNVCAKKGLQGGDGPKLMAGRAATTLTTQAAHSAARSATHVQPAAQPCTSSLSPTSQHFF